MFDVKKIRKDFKILNREVWDDKPLVYLDNAATTQKPNCVIDSIVNYYENYNANIHRGVHKLAEEATVAYENVREKVSRFINASDEDAVIFTRNATESMNLLAFCLGESLKEGDEVIISEMEHHANIIPWYLLRDRKKITVKFVPVTEKYELDYEALEKLITNKTKIVSITQKSNVLGTVNDIKKISKLAKLVDAIVIVDAAQSVPHMKVDFSNLGADFIVFSSHKMCGPTGVGVLVGKKELFEKMPPYMGGGEMIRKVTFEDFTCNDVPWKFEAGTPNIADVIAFGVAIDYLEKIGIEDIYEYEKELTLYALEKMKKFEFLKIYNPLLCHSRLDRESIKPLVLDSHPQSQLRTSFHGNDIGGSGLITFSNPVVHPHDIATIVDQYGVAIRAGHHCAQPLMKKLGVSSTCRASFYFYNTKEEIDIFINVLKKALEYFEIGACKNLKQVSGKG